MKFDFSEPARWKVEDATVGLSRLGTARMLIAAGFGKVSAVVAPSDFNEAMGELTAVTDEELAEMEAQAAE